MKFRYIAGILLAAIMAAATVFVAAGCDEDETVAATGVTLSKTELSLTVGESVVLTATVTPDNATDKSVTWTSSDPAVATVEGGEVTAVAEGGATITAACGEVSASVSCTVSAAQEPDRTTVTEAEWEAAFAEEKFENFRMTVDYYRTDADGNEIDDIPNIYDYSAEGGKETMKELQQDNTIETFYSQKTEDGYLRYTENEDGTWSTEVLPGSLLDYMGILPVITPITDRYADFRYDETAQQYLGTFIADEIQTHYTVSFQNGVLHEVHFTWQNPGGIEYFTVYFTFGGQSIQLPETGPSAGSREEWDAAFSADKFENMKFEVRDLNGAQTPAMDYIVADGKEYLKRTGVRNSIPFTDEFYSLQTQTEYTQYYRDSKSQWKSRSSQNSLLIDEGEGFGDVLLAPLKDAYENFTYDDAQKCYVGKMDFGGELFDVNVVIENGMLSQISGTPEQCLITFTFGNQTVELPPEIGAIS